MARAMGDVWSLARSPPARRIGDGLIGQSWSLPGLQLPARAVLGQGWLLPSPGRQSTQCWKSEKSPCTRNPTAELSAGGLLCCLGTWCRVCSHISTARASPAVNCIRAFPQDVSLRTTIQTTPAPGSVLRELPLHWPTLAFLSTW